MPLPSIADVDESRALIETVGLDPRITELRRAFTPGAGLEAIIDRARRRFLDECAPDVLDDDHRRQLETIVRHWTESVDWPTVELADRSLESLRADARRWDFRLGAERDAIPAHADLLPDDVRGLVQEIAGDWGMTGGDPAPTGTADAVVAIGGLVRANIGRPATVAAWLQEGFSTAVVLGLAGERTTSDREKRLARSIGAPEESEQASLRFGLERAFRLDPSAWHLLEQGVSENASGGVPVVFGVAPLTPTGKRVTTGEALTWMLARNQLLAGGSVLQMTTSIYGIANQIDARISIPASTRVWTRGYREELAPGPRQAFRAQHYLQEIKAVLDALPRLARWVDAQ